jgi:hypothetical protein
MPPFVKGKPRHPNAGRKKGTPNRGTVRARRLISEGADREIIDKIVTDARAGDWQAQAHEILGDDHRVRLGEGKGAHLA